MAKKDDDIDLDEIDQMLRDAEKKYGVAGKGETNTASKVKPRDVLFDASKQIGGAKSQPTSSVESFLQEVDDDLADLDELVTPTQKRGSPSSKKIPASLKKIELPLTKKCFPVLIGGSQSPLGLSASGQQRSCSALRCTRCDFKVLSFDNREWAGDCDYLFFRNSMPVLERLREKLRTRTGHRAYACQCQWVTVSDVTYLQDMTHLKWVCAGRHPT